jgi:hypothetical protein
MTDHEKYQKALEGIKAEESRHAETRKLLTATEADRDQWKALAQANSDKLVMIREGLREVLEGTE